MHYCDFIILAIYMLGVLSVGYYFFRQNKDTEDYYVGGRSMGPFHVGLSVAATDVGGGFSIGLGGLGYVIGLSGSWLLFTGLLGAWLSAVLIIPKIKKIDARLGMMTYPDFLRYRYGPQVALLAAIISGVGYLGFTGAQILAGAKLFSATILKTAPLGMDPLEFSIYTIAVVIIAYTVLGGIKAVIYTDTVQWIILLIGLLLAIPFAVIEIGGIAALKAKLPDGYLGLTNISWTTFINWMIIILPIWFIAMTLYQRIYACKDRQDAQKAWYIAGLFEYPVMAFTGVFLGMCSSVLFPHVEAEAGLPLLIKNVLPIGITGLVVASYFSAIMSTADSCLMASSGNFVNDIIARLFPKPLSSRQLVWLSQGVTLVIGIVAVVMASKFSTVLGAILYAYAFMVSGLLVPTLGAYFWKRSSAIAAFWSMVVGGSITIVLIMTTSSSLLTPDDIVNPQALLQQLKDERHPLSSYVQKHFSSKALEALAQEKLHQQRRLLIKQLNRVLKGRLLYNQKRFATVELAPEIKKLLKQKLQGALLIHCNRLLLQAAYPQTIASRPLRRMPLGLDPTFFGIIASALIFLLLCWLFPGEYPTLTS